MGRRGRGGSLRLGLGGESRVGIWEEGYEGLYGSWNMWGEESRDGFRHVGTEYGIVRCFSHSRNACNEGKASTSHERKGIVPKNMNLVNKKRSRLGQLV